MAGLMTMKQIQDTMQGARAYLGNLDTATHVRYAPTLDAFVLKLSNGTHRVLAREQLQALRNASRDDVSRIEVAAGGSALRWPDLDLELSVGDCLAEANGSRTHL